MASANGKLVVVIRGCFETAAGMGIENPMVSIQRTTITVEDLVLSILEELTNAGVSGVQQCSLIHNGRPIPPNEYSTTLSTFDHVPVPNHDGYEQVIFYFGIVEEDQAIHE